MDNQKRTTRGHSERRDRSPSAFEEMDAGNNLMVSTILVFLICFFGMLQFSTCSRSNNVLLGRVEAQVGPYTVAVTDCYRTAVPAPQKLEDTPDGKPVYRFIPCRDADILIKGNELIVNERSYGDLKQGDTIVVDHGKVLVNDTEATVKSR